MAYLLGGLTSRISARACPASPLSCGRQREDRDPGRAMSVAALVSAVWESWLFSGAADSNSGPGKFQRTWLRPQQLQQQAGSVLCFDVDGRLARRSVSRVQRQPAVHG